MILSPLYGFLKLENKQNSGEARYWGAFAAKSFHRNGREFMRAERPSPTARPRKIRFALPLPLAETYLPLPGALFGR